jgi:hypothetical protein
MEAESFAKNGDSAIRMTDRRSNLPVLARGAIFTPPAGPSGTPRVRPGFMHTGLRLLRAPFSQGCREQFEYAVLGLLLAIPASGAASYGRHSDVRTG